MLSTISPTNLTQPPLDSLVPQPKHRTDELGPEGGLESLESASHNAASLQSLLGRNLQQEVGESLPVSEEDNP
eukprot:CAMPEP_0184299478 /NCGR_PEP_ID=MMETSP1049-20130417/10086_1 /TAXON_ID=77928 /ORGANISM="Proteomonas sulcata, Strain CCMP704" /LENGTH=72 /DNA_ID=CAMNT_0026609927 /DNA_START=434 /DNA_END=652 /DNA_ORIENTATION=-